MERFEDCHDANRDLDLLPMRATWLLAAGALAVSGCAGNTRQAPASVPAQEIAPKTSHVSTVEPVPAMPYTEPTARGGKKSPGSEWTVIDHRIQKKIEMEIIVIVQNSE